MTPARVICFLGFAVSLSACIPAQRINRDCRFTEPARPLDLSLTADRNHLRDDARLAEELGVRHGDATRGRETIPERTARAEGCTGALFDQIARLHGVPALTVAAAAQQREAWVDGVFVFLPAALVYWLLCVVVVDRMNARLGDEDDRTRLWLLLLAAPFISGLGLFLGEMWAWLVEMVRIHDMHISYRAFRLPWVRHRLALFLLGTVVFLVLAHQRRRTMSLVIKHQA